MKNKLTIAVIISTLISLGIGIAIGVGINQKGLFGTAVGSLIQNKDGMYIIDGKDIDLATLMMELNLERSQDLDKQIADQMNAIKERNNKLKEANEIIAIMRQAKADANGISDEIRNFFVKNGLEVTEIVNGNNNELRDSQWDGNIQTVKGYIDSLNSDSQLAMTRLQSLVNKRNQTFEAVSNFLSKGQKTRDSIISNFR